LAFPIVAIGASAGGLEAVSELLAALRPKSDMAYVVVQHLDPGHESLLAELLGKKTTMPVESVHDGIEIQANHVYVIPPNASLTMHDEQLHLAPRTCERPHHPADIFFTSLAEARGDAAIGVVLSGADADGSHGVQAIKHSGGITFAQEPATARFPGMPNRAIETGCVDFVMRPSEIARELGRLGSLPYLRAAPGSPSELPEEEHLRRAFRRLRAAHGVDFTHYKRSTLRRRIERRMALRKIDELPDYVAVLEDDPAEVAALYQDFLIRVTGFFRDPESFEGLVERVFPSVCEARSSKDPIRIWVPGCATGEEVYSIAMTLVEYLGERLSPHGIQIFGTDVSEAAIEKARAGCYLDNITEEVSAEHLKRFFTKEDAHYRVAKSLRDLCIFARQDVTRDPPFSRLDLVSCRNVLIYLDTAAQRRVMQVFHYSLRPRGFLLLGPSESVGASDLFELIDKHHRLYTRKATSAARPLDFGPRGRVPDTPPGGPPVAGDEPIPVEAESAQSEADRVLLAQYAPASLLVDEALNILQVRGETGPYLELASGPPSLNLHRVARPELLVEITPAVTEARETGSAVRRKGLCVDELTDITLQVIPLKTASPERCYLIIFEDAARRPPGRRAQQTALIAALPESEKDRRLVQLEREITSTRDYLQATMEEHEAVKEELKSAHEEVLSANEEFQSTNEELETAKEELQSANEELTTTNDELRTRNNELSVLNSRLQKARETAERARAYADAIVSSVPESLLVLDSKLTVLRGNQAFYQFFKTRPEDTEGRSLGEIGAKQWDVAELLQPVDAVLRRDIALENYELSYDLPGTGKRSLHVAARKIPGDTERSELILLVIEDVTAAKAQGEADQLRETNRRKDEFLAMLAHELRNPLAPITHAIHLLRRETDTGTAAKLHELIERQTRRLTRLVDQLLDIARVSQGRIDLKLEVVNLVAIARQAIEASRPWIEERHHELLSSLPEAPALVDGDPVRLEQIVSNLLENAAKYTDPGGRIQLQLTQDSGEALLSVRDNGIGLAPESLKSIFELFSQVDTSLARSTGGLGVGLTLVRRLLELHGGRIESHSAGLGRGSEFIVRLPLARANDIGQQTVHGNDNGRTQASGRQRVLIVDDNKDAAESLALLVRYWGHEVEIAGDGLSALALAERFRPARALVDIGLPGMSGYELGQRLREAHPHIYLVAMTGYGREEDRRAAHSAGFDVHLVKPGDLEHLHVLLANGGPQPST
jgi:two-component system CheB/CheR fusion protein